MNILRLIVLLVSLIGCSEVLVASVFSSEIFAEAEADVTLKNSSYSINISKKSNGTLSIEIERIGKESTQRILNPTMTVFFAVKDPVYARGRINEGSSPVACWGKQREIDLWKQGNQIVLTAARYNVKEEQTVIFQFEEDEKFILELTMDLPKGSAPPEFSWSIKAKLGGWYSVGFTGLDAQEPEPLDFLYQPLVWSWKRFPAEAVLTPEAFATTAASFTN